MLRSSLISEFQSGVSKELMMYRTPLPVIQAVILLLFLFAVTKPMHAAEEKPWNVVFFLVDDLGWTDLGCYGSDFYQKRTSIGSLLKASSQTDRCPNACPQFKELRNSVNRHCGGPGVFSAVSNCGGST